MGAVTKLQLIEAVEPTLEDLFRAHHADVFAAAHRITGNAMDAEDVLQTVFLRFARRERALDAPSKVGPYLCRAAVNAALDIVRARKRGPADLEDSGGPGWLADDNPVPEQRVRDTELRERLRRALAGVSPRSAEIFALRYFEGYGNREIADMLGTSPSAVGVVLHRTRGVLRDTLDTA